MGTLCKDRYLKSVGCEHRCKHYMAPTASYANCGKYWWFQSWTGLWKTAYQAASGTRERIWYDTGFYPVGGCEHWKYSVYPSSSEPRSLDPSPLCHWLDIWPAGDAGDMGIYYPNDLRTGWMLPELRIPSAEQLAGCHANAWRYFDNAGIDKQLDLSVSLTESPGWIDFAKQMTNKKESILKKLAQAKLFYAFGLAPLASDIFGLYKAVCEVPERLAFLQKNLGKPVKMHYNTKVPIGSSGIKNNWTNTRWAHEILNAKCEYHAQIKCVYELDDMSVKGASLKAEAYKHALGFTNPLTWIWEKIPFSFLIDYLIGIGDFFEEIGGYEIFKNYEVTEQLYSIKCTQTTRYGVNWETRTDHGMKWASNIFSKYYRREGSLPRQTDLPPINFNTPGITQLINSVALLIGVKPSKH